MEHSGNSEVAIGRHFLQWRAFSVKGVRRTLKHMNSKKDYKPASIPVEVPCSLVLTRIAILMWMGISPASYYQHNSINNLCMCSLNFIHIISFPHDSFTSTNEISSQKTLLLGHTLTLYFSKFALTCACVEWHVFPLYFSLSLCQCCQANLTGQQGLQNFFLLGVPTIVVKSLVDSSFGFLLQFVNAHLLKEQWLTRNKCELEIEL